MSLLSQSRCSLSAQFLLLALLVFASSTDSRAAKIIHHESSHNAKREVEALEEVWRTAQISGDVAMIDRLLSDDYIGISMTGQANTKTQQLDRFRNRTLVITRIDVSDRKIKLVGSVAIVTSRADVEGVNEGESMKGMFRYTRVYQRLPSGVWKTTNFEATKIPQNRMP